MNNSGDQGTSFALSSMLRFRAYAESRARTTECVRIGTNPRPRARRHLTALDTNILKDLI
jgi:hypothetical protein